MHIQDQSHKITLGNLKEASDKSDVKLNKNLSEISVHKQFGCNKREERFNSKKILEYHIKNKNGRYDKKC